MIISKENRIKELQLRIKKLEINPTENANLIRKAQRQIRKLNT